MREEFEKLLNISTMAKPHRMIFSKEKNKYLSTDSCFSNETSYVNGAWYAYQEQQKKIDDIQKEKDEHICDFAGDMRLLKYQDKITSIDNVRKTIALVEEVEK